MSDPLTAAAFAMHLAACVAQDGSIADAPSSRVIAHAIAESRLHPLALHDNATNREYDFATPAEAVAKAQQLVAQGHGVDAGVMQVDDANWRAYGLTVATVFDPRTNICAGANILAEAFAIERRAACRYNTGRPTCQAAYPEAVDRAEAKIAGGPLPASPPPPNPYAAPIVAFQRFPQLEQLMR